jgi:O-methyltransferase
VITSGRSTRVGKRAVKYVLRKTRLLDQALIIKKRLTTDSEAYFSRFPTYDPVFNGYTSADPVRYRTIALAISNIQKSRLPGSFAELGVWRGDLSRFIHAMAPERVLCLFDTFEGFPEQDLEIVDERFRDTSVDTVKKTIGDLRNLRFIKGRFPDTCTEIGDSETFAFVMLDMDLHDPTLAALEFFYPRLDPGGYLFAHDYNSPESNHGVRRAIDEFFRTKPESVIELPDAFGSVVVRRLRTCAAD